MEMELETLREAVRRGIVFLQGQHDVVEGLVYASANRRLIARIAFTSHMPCEGLLEPKSSNDYGVSVHVVLRGNDGKTLEGFGQEANDVSLVAVQNALEKARRDASEDPDFHSLPNPDALRGLTQAVDSGYHDRPFMQMSEDEEAILLAQAGWETLDGAIAELRTWCENHGVSPNEAEFIVSGDQFFIKEQMAVATTSGIDETDETTLCMSFVTAMLERKNSKGSGFDAVTHLANLKPLEIGRCATRSAINGVGNVRVPSGRYNVIFGPQALVDLFHLISLSLNLGVVEAGGGIFVGSYGREVASPLFSMYDDGAMPRGAGTKRITCEGYPTRRVDLIRCGQLVGFLTNDYMARRVLSNPDAEKFLGVDPGKVREVITPAANGFRFERGGGRIAASGTGISATNVVIESPEKLTEEELLSRVQNGIYVGRLWYTYPVGGYSTGDISGTAVADSYLIKDGKLSTPLTPNSIRINDNLKRMLLAVMGVTQHRVPTIVWASDEIIYAPWVAIQDVNIMEIGTFL